MGEIDPSYHGFRIKINSDDHYPPHVHVMDLDSKKQSRIRIDNGNYLKGDDDLGAGSKKLRKHISREIQSKCIDEWNRLHPDLPYIEGYRE